MPADYKEPYRNLPGHIGNALSVLSKMHALMVENIGSAAQST